MVVVGDRGNSLMQHYARLGLSLKNVLFTGYVAKDELICLYENAAALFFASLYEGFGNPVLEAAQFGTPAIISVNSSLPEVSGYPVELCCNPECIDDIAKTALQIITDESIRNQLVQIGLNNLQRYSWKKMATETSELYNSVL
jgi:glycosyltransferase involved in cell wall biosynthesis